MELNQSDAQVAVSENLGKTYANLAFSPDGRWLAAAELEQVFLLDVATGQIAATFESLVEYGMTTLAFSADGAYLLANSAGGFMVFDVATGEATLTRVEGGVAAIASSGDEVWAASARGDQVVVWDLTIEDGIPNFAERITVDIEACAAFSAVFSPDGSRLGLAGGQGCAAAIDLATGEVQVLEPAQEGYFSARFLSFSPDGTLLAVARTSEALVEEARFFDVTSGILVGTLALDGDGFFKGLMFSPIQPLLAALFDFEIQLWGYSLPAGTTLVAGGEGEPAAAGNPAAAAAYAATAALTAKYHPNGRLTCPIETGEAVLPVGQMPGGAVLAYAGGATCEGPVWLTRQDAMTLAGIDEAALNSLAIVANPGNFTVFDRENTIPDYAEVCASATSWGTPPVGGPPYRAAWPSSSLPDDLQANSDTGLDVVVCIEDIYVPIETCHYTSATGEHSATYERRRSDKRVTVVDYARHTIIAQQTFYGGTPNLCPDRISGDGFNSGPMPDYEIWNAWVIDTLTGSGAPIERTTVASSTINARSEPTTSSEVITQLAAGTTVNLIGRNEAGDWALALLPDMTRVWLYADLLQIARRTKLSLLPVAAGPAAAVPLP